ncbi:MAG: hypothetical protein AB1489_41515 [Acidobacteriota bacterium]
MLKRDELSTLTLEAKQKLITNAVEKAISKLLKRDLDLLAIGAHEQAICHRLAVYLEEHTDLNVDCEYNRKDVDPKKLANEELFRPDILIHKRLDVKFNLFALEAKSSSNTTLPRGKTDREKILELVGKGAFNYCLGALFHIHNKKTDILPSGILRIKLTWFDCSGKVLDGAPIEKSLDEDLLKHVHKRKRV